MIKTARHMTPSPHIIVFSSTDQYPVSAFSIREALIRALASRYGNGKHQVVESIHRYRDGAWEQVEIPPHITIQRK